MKKKGYGWRPQKPDHRDLVHEPGVVVLPTRIDRITRGIAPVFDQGALGSCTANACGSLWEHRMWTEMGAVPQMPSRLFIYYNERAIEGTISVDAGAEVRDGLKSMAKYGVPPEYAWPYDIKKFAKKPPKAVYTKALLDIALQYKLIQIGMTAIRRTLANGNPIVGGFTVFESFESAKVAKTGLMPMPKKNEKAVGGHCVLWDGYDDRDSTFWCRNSWGSAWGIGGWFKMPYANLANCSDFWVLLKVK